MDPDWAPGGAQDPQEAGRKPVVGANPILEVADPILEGADPILEAANPKIEKVLSFFFKEGFGKSHTHVWIRLQKLV